MGDLVHALLARGDGGGSRQRSRASSSSPRSTGTSSGPSSNRGSTTPTTSVSTIGWRRATRARSASTSRPASTSRTAWPASSRTTTSRAPLPRSRPGAPSGRGPHVPHSGPPLLPPGPAGGEAGAHSRPPRPRARRGPRRRDRRVLRPAAGLPEGPGLPRRRLAAPRGSSGVVRKRLVGRLRGLRLDRPGRRSPPRRRQLRRSPEPVLPGDALARPRRADVAPAGPRRARRLRPSGRRPGAGRGLYLDLPAWGYHVFAVSTAV